MLGQPQIECVTRNTYVPEATMTTDITAPSAAKCSMPLLRSFSVIVVGAEYDDISSL